MRRSGLLPFFALTFGYTWGVGLLYALAPHLVEAIAGPMSMGSNWLVRTAVYAPTLAALTVAALQGRAALGDLFARLLRWRIGLAWYVLPVLGIALISIAARLAAGAPIALQPLGQWPAVAGAAALALFVDPGPLGEELGWRGFALPRLQERWNGLTSALVLGTVWAVWHLPAFLIPGLPQHEMSFWAFLVSVASASVLMTFVVNKANGSVLPAILMHWADNQFADLHPAVAPYTTGAFALAAIVMILVAGAGLGAPRSKAISGSPVGSH
jgi:membrane protease YdiL (CAAX protease family)